MRAWAIVLLAFGIVGCATQTLRSDNQWLDVSGIEIAPHGLVFALGEETHDYDIIKYRVTSSPSMEHEIEIAVPVEGSGVYAKLTSHDQNVAEALRDLYRSRQPGRISIAQKALEKYQAAKRQHSPLALVYSIDVQQISSVK